MIIHNVEQLSPQWFELRAKKLTASHAKTIKTNGAGLETYVYNKLAAYYSSAEKEMYTNVDIQRGIDLEPQARAIYELVNDVEIEEVGFVELNEYVGCSPDGLLPDKGIEIKCHKDEKHFRLALNSQIDDAYYWQMQMCMLICERDSWDYVAYNPNFKESLVVINVKANKDDQEKLLKGFETGKKLIKQITEQYEQQ